MNLKLRNILKIEEADIRLGGLTVITGENNTGKSTVGKILFSLIKAFKQIDNAEQSYIESRIYNELYAIRRQYRNYPDVVSFLRQPRVWAKRLINADIPFQGFKDDLLGIIENNHRVSNSALLDARLNRIESLLLNMENPEEIYKQEFHNIALSEFMQPLNSFGKTDSYILFHDDTTDMSGSDISIRLNEGSPSDVRLWGSSSIDDITYVESPIYLQILSLFRSSSLFASLYRRPGAETDNYQVPFHLVDMAEKMTRPSSPMGNLFFDSYGCTEMVKKIKNEIREITGGSFAIDERNQRLSFRQEGLDLSPLSVATGIKSLGVVQRLLETDNLSPFNMLIWDEPEIHLHPEWQVNLCRILVELVANGVPVVVSTHSPYFVQGLRYFAAAKLIENDVAYYLAEKQKNSELVRMVDVTNDLNRVFSLLSEPLQQIMNVDEARGSLMEKEV